MNHMSAVPQQSFAISEQTSGIMVECKLTYYASPIVTLFIRYHLSLQICKVTAWYLWRTQMEQDLEYEDELRLLFLVQSTFLDFDGTQKCEVVINGPHFPPPPFHLSSLD